MATHILVLRASSAVEPKQKFGSKTQQRMLQQWSYFPKQKMAREQLHLNLGKNGLKSSSAKIKKEDENPKITSII